MYRSLIVLSYLFIVGSSTSIAFLKCDSEPYPGAQSSCTVQDINIHPCSLKDSLNNCVVPMNEDVAVTIKYVPHFTSKHLKIRGWVFINDTEIPLTKAFDGCSRTENSFPSERLSTEFYYIPARSNDPAESYRYTIHIWNEKNEECCAWLWLHRV